MCDCKNVNVGEYTNQTTLKVPTLLYNSKYFSNEYICVDTCLVEEIIYLWDNGIRTTGCCCGHNKLIPYIGVIEEDVDKMIEMGYKILFNPNGIDNCLRCDSFYPITVDYTKEMYVDSIKHFINTL